MWKIILLVIAHFSTPGYAENCAQRKFQANSYVCVCNSTYCDFLNHSVPTKGRFVNYKSSRDGGRLESEKGVFQDTAVGGAIKLNLNLSQKYQKILGFGGAFTDSAGYNLIQLSKETREKFIRTHFAPEGSHYSLGRTPIGGSDFSIRGYTLADAPGDVTLSHFSLASEDRDWKIPFMKEAIKLNPDLKIIAAPWSAPPWMKTVNSYESYQGVLKDEYYQIYANYLIKFLEAYKNEGVPIWAMSAGNEPENVFKYPDFIIDMGWKPDTITKWILNNLGPTLESSKSSETVLFVGEDQRSALPEWIEKMYETNNSIDQYIYGISNHWYHDKKTSPTILDQTHQKFLTKVLMMTEACIERANKALPTVNLGNWDNAERYMHSIIENLNHWSSGWIDWNLALDMTGGPNWENNHVDASVIIEKANDEFYKQPTFYALAHFSKFLPRESYRVDITNPGDIESIAFVTPQGEVVIVLFNAHDTNRLVTIFVPGQGYVNVELQGHSFNTIVFMK